MSSFFRQIGFDFVFDLSLARHLALGETIREFKDKFDLNQSLPINQRSTLLCSVCPGFVCYVEKTHPQLVPLLSKVKSPQQTQGYLVKNVWCTRNEISVDQLYHVTLMPCFDKKLEASRKEFEQNEFKDVDCVITPVELELMLEREQVKWNELPETKLDLIFSEQSALLSNTEQIVNHIGSGSGGYAEHVYRSALNWLLDSINADSIDLNYESKRNKDFVELHVKQSGDDSSQTKLDLNVAIVNGFRNIQTIVQRHKRKMLRFDYIEVMACPTGCLNGGGLLRDVSFDRIEAKYKQCDPFNVDFNLILQQHAELCSHLFQTNEDEQVKALHTTFNVIPKMENALHIAW